MSNIALAIQQVEKARQYTTGLVNDTDDDQWFEQPFEGANHIAWQVGHIVVAQYGLTLAAVRGRHPEDAEWLPKGYAKMFGRESTPQTELSGHPTPDELRAALDTVHDHVISGLQSVEPDVFDDKPEWEVPMCATKLEAVHFCALHEMVHAGQIGMLRRMLGRAYLR